MANSDGRSMESNFIDMAETVLAMAYGRISSEFTTDMGKCDHWELIRLAEACAKLAQQILDLASVCGRLADWRLPE